MKARFNRTMALLLALALYAVPAVLASERTYPNPTSTAKSVRSSASAVDAYGDAALAFEQNRGQADPAVLYTAHSSDGTLAFAADRVVYATPSGPVTMHFGEAQSVDATGQLAAVTNYLVGHDPSAWHTDVPSYARITYSRVFPGVDLVFYGSKGAPEYDFVVAPGADPSAIEMSFDGALSASVDDSGALVLATASGDLRHERPAIFQDVDGARTEIAGSYVVDGTTVRFDIGAYDSTRELVIDPVLDYLTYLGGNADDRINAAAVDDSGNLVVVGQTLSSNYHVIGGIASNMSGMDGFITKLNANGTGVVFSTYIGGSGTDNLNGVTLDGSGRIFVVGSSASNDFPTVNGYDNNPNGLDAVLAVLNASGSTVTYGSFIGGSNNDIGDAVAVDIHGNVYMAGETLETGLFGDFPTKSPSSLPPFQDEFNAGRSDAFVTKWDPDVTGNSSLVYSTLIGGTEGEGVNAIAVDANERAYVCGYTESADFPRLNAIENSYGGGTEDAFITKFNADGTAIFYSTYFGGSGIEEANGIAIDTTSGDNRPVVCGFTTSSNINTQLANDPTLGGPEDAFVCKLNDTGNQYLYSTYLGGTGNDAAQAMTIDSVGNTYLTGFSNGGFPLVDPIAIPGQSQTNGIVLAIYNPAGTVLRSTCVVPGNGFGVAVDPAGDVYIAGTTSITNLPVTAGAFQTNFAGAPNDGFALKLDMTNDDTLGVFKPSPRQFLLRNANISGSADITVTFGATGDKPIVGDWDGNGTTTIGTYSPATGTFNLRNSNTAGAANFTFQFGSPNLIPIAGDWDGDGDDTIGVFDPATNVYFLKNSLAGGNADITFQFGLGGQGATPIAGDWNGDGVDTIGFYQASSRTFFLKNTNANGNADLQFVFGPSSATPIAGDWNGDGVDTVATFSRVSTLPLITTMKFTFTNTNAAGTGDFVVAFGTFGDAPIVGNWDGQ